MSNRWRSDLEPFTLVCPVWHQEYQPAPGDFARYTDSVMVWCSCCQAHGNRKLHLVRETWQRETASADEAPTVELGAGK